MVKMSTDLTRQTLSGETMGTRWSALVYTEAGFERAPLQAALQAAVDRVDRQMSTWRSDSDLMRFNAAPPGQWFDLPPELMTVLACALEIGRASGGAFEIGMGDAVWAWGFGPADADEARIKSALVRPRRPSFEVLDLDLPAGRARKTAAIALDLSGIAKGFGVDQLTEVLLAQGFGSGLLAIDGEVRALGRQPDGKPWPIAVEAPERDHRTAHSLLALENVSVATSGDYRHWVQVGERQLSHTMDPRTGTPLMHAPASVTVLAETCMRADALATALMVMGASEGPAFARANGIEALFMLREGFEIRLLPIGESFAEV
jgi:thiamine biosynthesis lipoprotein